MSGRFAQDGGQLRQMDEIVPAGMGGNVPFSSTMRASLNTASHVW